MTRILLHYYHHLPEADMLSKEESFFYQRHLLLDDFGEKGQVALKKAKVLIVGAGGLGCPVLSYLAGAGVGCIGIIDGDKVDITNLHRQILFRYKDVGRFKSDVALQQIKDLNPYIRLKGYNKQLSAGNVLSIVKEYDIIVDATDNFPARYLINDACVILNKPFVFASIDRFQGQLSVFNFKKGPTYRCIFPKPPKPETAPNCSQTGVLGVLPGILGVMQANEVIKMIVGLEDILSGKILMIDTLKNNYFTIKVKRNEIAVKSILDLKSGVKDKDYYVFCNSFENKDQDISAAEVLQRIKKQEKFQFIDVRDTNGVDNIKESIHIPLSKIDQDYTLIKKDTPAILYCDQGITSKIAVDKLRKYGLKNVYNLAGGLYAWNILITKNRI